MAIHAFIVSMRRSMRRWGERSGQPPVTVLMVAAFLLTAGLIAGVAITPFSHSRTRLHASMQLNAFPGFTVVRAPSPQSGLIVTSLRSNGPAQQSGIAVGDIVEALDSRRVTSPAAAVQYLRNDPNDAVRIRVLHKDSVRDVTLPLDGDQAHGA